MLQQFAFDDPKLDERLGSAHSRMQHLIDEADAKARVFYKKVLGEELSIQACIERIFSEVETDGDEAVCRYSQAFDNSSIQSSDLVVGPEGIAAAWEACPDALRNALSTATAQVRAYQERLLLKGFGENLDESLGVRWLPLQRVGAYVPGGAGGTLPLCSSVIMNLVPAAVAGVKELVLCTPARADGSVAPEILAACYAAGVQTVYKAGGIQAIAAMACGTAQLPAVDKIVGPGNIFVTLSKRYAYGRVDIDMLAGPSEVLIINDGSVDPAWVAADLISQAEHDTLAMCVLLSVGDNDQAVLDEIQKQIDALPDERRAVAAASINNHGIYVACPDVATAVNISNRFAPEHLELLVENPKAIINDITNAGAVFVGAWSPEPIGDYIAGPSHTLPTGGSARMWSGIGADTFLKRSSIINFSEQDFDAVADAAITMAEAEGLHAHARSLMQRRDRQQ